MPHLVATGSLHPSGVALLKQLPSRGVTVTHVQSGEPKDMLPHLATADALLLRMQPLTAELLDLAPKLRVVSRHGVGYDAVDVPALSARGIALTIVGDVLATSCAEQALMLILAAAKRALRADRSVRSPAEWHWRNGLEAVEISGKNLLIVGFGRIGQRLAGVMSGFGMQMRAHDPQLQKAGWPQGPVQPAPDLMDALAWADVVSLHIPKTDTPLIGAAELAAMKPSAILVNTARGGVVDEAALFKALKTGQIGAAGLDVFAQEPPEASAPLLELDQVILSPHISGTSAESAEQMAIRSIENAVGYLQGRIAPELIVNRAELGI